MYNCTNGISIESKQNMSRMITGIFSDDDNNQKSKGLQSSDWIDVYETSLEAQALNEKVSNIFTFKFDRVLQFKKTQTNFADVVNAKLLDPKRKIKANEAGDGCCEGGETNEMLVLDLIPRLNETIMGEIIGEIPLT